MTSTGTREKVCLCCEWVFASEIAANEFLGAISCAAHVLECAVCSS